MVVEAQDGQRLAAGSELPVGHIVSGMDQFDQSSLPSSCQDAAVLSRGPASSGHQHRGPGQREELLSWGDKHIVVAEVNRSCLSCYLIIIKFISGSMLEKLLSLNGFVIVPQILINMFLKKSADSVWAWLCHTRGQRCSYMSRLSHTRAAWCRSCLVAALKRDLCVLSEL